MYLSKTKNSNLHFRLITMAVLIFVYTMAIPAAVLAADPPANEKACSKKEDGQYSGGKKNACIAGYNGGRELKDPAKTCDSYSGEQNDACMDGYGKGACSIKDPNQNALNKCLNQNPIIKDLRLVVNFLSAGVGIVIVGSVIFGAIQYILAGNNPNAVSAAKKRLEDTLIALLAFFFIYAFLSWLVPGGLLFNL
jgi:hypothetical protein